MRLLNGMVCAGARLSLEKVLPCRDHALREHPRSSSNIHRGACHTSLLKRRKMSTDPPQSKVAILSWMVSDLGLPACFIMGSGGLYSPRKRRILMPTHNLSV